MSNIVKIYLTNLKNKSIDDILFDYKNYLKEDDINKANKFGLDINKKQSLMSSAFKNKYVKGTIFYGEHGKPLSDCCYFNISHSNDCVILAISESYQVGIDIEKVKDEIKDDLIKYVCNQDEINMIQSPKHFYKIWTQKESILKLVGTGITHDIKNILIDKKYLIKTYEIEDYVYSIAIDANKNEQISIIKEEEYE